MPPIASTESLGMSDQELLGRYRYTSLKICQKISHPFPLLSNARVATKGFGSFSPRKNIMKLLKVILDHNQDYLES